MKKNPTGAKTMVDHYKAVAFSCLIGIIITAVVLFIAALIISSMDFPQSGIAPLATVASVAGCFAAGFLCSRITKSGGLLYGLLCGAVIFLLSLLCELSFLGGELGALAVYKLIICITSSMIGGVLGVNKRRKAR